MHVSRRYRLAYSRVLSVAVALLLALALSPGAAAKPKETALPPPPAPGATRYFEPNVGQFDDGIRFRARSGGYLIDFRDDGFELVASKLSDNDKAKKENNGHSLQSCMSQPAACVTAKIDSRLISTSIKFDGAATEPEALTSTPGVSNYYRGNDPSQHFLGVPRYTSLSYSGLYSGLDLIFRFNSDGVIEFDLDVAPGADPSQFGLNPLGNSTVQINPDGSLAVRGEAGVYLQSKPIVLAAGPTPGASFLLDGQVVRIVLDGPAPAGRYVIDPAITFSTYDTGSIEQPSLMDGNVRTARDPEGSLYTVGSVQTSYDNIDARVSKFTQAGSGIEPWDTYFGGTTGGDGGLGIDIWSASPDSDTWQVGVVGVTASIDFPRWSLDKSKPPLDGSLNGKQDAFVARLYANDPEGTALQGEINFSTYFGGNDDGCPPSGYCDAVEGAQGIAFDPSETVGDPPASMIIAGYTNAATGFPITTNAYQTVLNQGVAGPNRDSFVAKINPAFPPNGPANDLRFSSYFGGAGDEFIDIQTKTDADGNYWVTGMTNETVPTTDGAIQSAHDPGDNGSYDLFAVRFQAGTSNPKNSTMLGGNGLDTQTDLDVQGAVATLAAVTNSNDLISGGNGGSAAQFGHGGSNDAYVAQIEAAQSGSGTTQVYGSYLGGPGIDFGRGVGVSGTAGQIGQRIIVSGGTSSPLFPVANQIPGEVCGSGGIDSFISVIDTGSPTPASLSYSTCFGGGDTDNSEDLFVWGLPGAETVALVGLTLSSDFPVAKGTPGTDPALYEPYATSAFTPRSFTGFVTVFDLAATLPESQGSYMAFSSNRGQLPFPDETYPGSSIWKVAPDGSSLSPVTPLSGSGEYFPGIDDVPGSHDGDDDQPAISPNGQRILYVSNRNPEGTRDLYVVSKSGPSSYICRLTNSSFDEHRPAWSQDGASIAYSVDDAQGNRDIFAAGFHQGDISCPNANAVSRVQVTNAAPFHADAPTFSPNSACIAYMAGEIAPSLAVNLYLAPNPFTAAGQCAATQLTIDGAFNSYPTWSIATPGYPSGRIAFGSVRYDSQSEPPPEDVRLWILNPVNPGVPTGPLFTFAGVHTGANSPSWSPDGATLLAYGSDHPDGDFDIWRVVPADGDDNVNVIEAAYGVETNTRDWWPSFGPGPAG